MSHQDRGACLDELFQLAMDQRFGLAVDLAGGFVNCLLYTSPSPRDATLSRMPSSA